MRLAATVGPPEATLTVSDDGPGIPEHLLPDRLFDPFVSAKPGGSGIGLWQARLVLERLGATIAADNPAEGGARLVVGLPRGANE